MGSHTEHLPDAYRWLAPELWELEPPAEKTADCANCPMVRRADETTLQRTVFDPVLRCCTYNPVLYNFLVGRILRRGGRGAEAIRRRLANPDGVNRWAIRPDRDFYERARETPRGGFGRDTSRKCPYWVADGSGRNCSVWEDRGAVCRSWFCQHDGGWKGRELWDGHRDLLWILQVKLARWLAEAEPAPPEDAEVEAWCAYYARTADRLDAATEAEVRALADDGLATARADYRRRWQALRDPAIPEVLGPCVTAFYDLGDDGVMLEGYSHYSPTIWPRGVWVLFSVMDGTVGWRDALDHAERSLGERIFTEADIREMVRLGLLESRRPEDLVVGARLRGVPADRVQAGDAQEMVEFEWPFDPRRTNPG